MNRVAGLFRLEVRDFESPMRWRWVLIDESDGADQAVGTEVVSHYVRLDAANWQFEAFADLLEYLSWHVAPDRRPKDEARIVRELGAWIEGEVFGPVAAVLAEAAPATVRVVVPPEARALAFRPFALAYAGNKPLAAQDVTLVVELGTSAAQKTSVGARLRVLGLFSLPEGGQPLNLRRERHNLVGLIERIAANGKDVDVRVLQYGVTRSRLRGVLKEAEGWDIIHISGHGAPGELLLETAAGQPDRVTADELAELLDLARERVRLVTVSACWSAALTTAEQRRMLGLPVPDQNARAERLRESRPVGADSSGALATALADRLDCAVLAMRYPVNDDFATTLSSTLYELLVEKGQSLPRAVGIALGQLSTSGASDLSVATPALFGAQAVGLRLAAPDRTGRPSLARPKMTGFPPLPDRFVGRTRVMARASTALAAESGIPGVLLYGMPGGGKTACALELAYGHEHAFETLIWYKAPDEGMAVDGALTDFALTLERYMGGFQMAHLLATDNGLAEFLPRLTEMMKQSRLLVVIDNAESLMSGDGGWQDVRWGQLIAALTTHTGLGRVIITSRRVLPRLIPSEAKGIRTVSAPEPSSDAIRLQIEAVDALSADEALLLARELPRVKALLGGKLPGIGRSRSQRLARGVLSAAGGHPKLLELADGQAADPDRLAALLADGDRAWRERRGLPHGFFATGEVALSEGRAAAAADYWHVLAAWTRSITNTLAPGEQDLFWFLCCLEDRDRQRWVLGDTWADLWQRLGREGEPPDLDEALAVISATSLITTQSANETYAVHPGVAEAGRAHAGQMFRDAVDALAGGFWDSVHQRASGKVGGESVDTELLVRAGLAAVPYLLRQHRWDDAASLLEAAFVRDPTRANAAAVLPAIKQITGQKPQWSGVLAKVLAVTDPPIAVALLRTAMAEAAARGDYRTASANAGRLLELCRSTGQLPEALEAAEQKAVYTRQAGLGPWNQLADEVWRLQVLAAMGHSDQVLDEVTRLRARMATLPSAPDPEGGEAPWHVREALLDTGRYAAMLLGRHADALTLIDEVTASQRDRHAPASFIARSRYNNYFPLLRLGRIEEALAVLRECRQVFQDSRDTLMLGRTLGALADVEDARGHGDAAIRLERDSLRYKYMVEDVEGILISYHNLGDRLASHTRQPVLAFAAHLASAFVCILIGNDDIAESVEAAANDLGRFGADDIMPADVAELCGLVGDIPGTDLPGLIERFCPDPEIAEQALRDLIAQVRELASERPSLFSDRRGSGGDEEQYRPGDH
ncbi:CHAT domain-containing protein [Microbispora sp. CSR-4]|uniref:CHAT domain-containing protein n=1 Tax=Microbispora sp. CSR-4 TaxID=2592813 RepID=UPI00164F1B0C|nr:CHAT domain-containing protein [Microbispora sp. CSR-4]